MIDTTSKRFANFFVLAMLSMATANLLNYPYIPMLGVLSTVYFLILSVAATKLKYYRSEDSNFLWSIFSFFNLTTLFARVYVNSSGLVGPGASGNLGPVKVEQFWLGGIHLHHYWLGILITITGLFMMKKNISEIRSGAVLGTGLALIVDELGIILTQQLYHSWISYIALILVNTALFLKLSKSRPKL